MTVKLAVADLARYELSAALVALIVQVPTATARTTVPETVQIDVVSEVNVTAPVPEPPVVERLANTPTARNEGTTTEIDAWLICVATTGVLKMVTASM